MFKFLIAALFISTTSHAAIDPCNLPGGGWLPGWGCPQEKNPIPGDIPRWSFSGRIYQSQDGFRLNFLHYGDFRRGFQEQIYTGHHFNMLYRPWTNKEFVLFCTDHGAEKECGKIKSIDAKCIQVVSPQFSGKACLVR